MTRRALSDRVDGTVMALRLTVAAVPGHALVAAGCSLSLLIAAGLAAVTDQPAHRLWALLAGGGYLAAAVVALRARRTVNALRVATAGAVLLPTVVLTAMRIAQPEVGVVERSARTLVATGSPYLAHPVGVYDVNPYLPGMSAFGLPHLALPDTGIGDPRWWFLGVFVATAVAADRLVRHGRGTELVVWVVLANPVVALHAAVGGHDLPVVGLLALALALAGRGYAGRAGVALGVACTLKATAWPALAVLGAFVVVRFGWRRAARCVGVAVAIGAAAVLPVLVGPTARSAIGQVAGFPLAASAIASPAAAPTPGVLLSAGGTATRVVGYVLLGLVAAGFAGWLVVRPPRTVARAAWTLALALSAAALVLPTSRPGYAVYPLALAALALRAGALRVTEWHKPVGAAAVADHETAGLENAIASLSSDFPGVSRDRIATLVRAEHARYAGRPIRDYVPALVERAVRSRLQAGDLATAS